MKSKYIKHKTEQRVKIAKDYIIGNLTIREIEEKYGCSKSTLRLLTREQEVLTRVAEETGKTVEELEDMRDGRSTKKTDIDTMINASSDYLFGDLSLEDVGKKYNVDEQSVSRFLKRHYVLAGVAEETGKTIEELKAIRDAKLKITYDFSEKITILRDFLVYNLTSSQIREKYGTNRSSLRKWMKDPDVLAGVAEETGKTVEELKRRYKWRHGGCRCIDFDSAVSATTDLLFGDLSPKEFISKYNVNRAKVIHLSRSPEILASVSEQTGKTAEELENIRNSKHVTKQKYDATVMINASIDFLFNGLTANEAAVKYNVSAQAITRSSNEPKILADVAKRTDKTIEEVMTIRKERGRGRHAIDIMVSATTDFLFSNLTAKEVAAKDEYNVHAGTILRWSKSPDVLTRVTEQTGKTVEELEAIRNAKLGGYNGRIRSVQALAELIQSESDARLVVQRFGGDDADVADILAVVYDGRLSRDDAILFLQDPSLRDYLGRFRRGDGIEDIFEAGIQLLPYDKNNVIRDIIYRRALEYRGDQLGPMPTREQRQGFLQELDKEIAALN